MPNWCHNVVKIEGKKEEVVRFLNDLVDKPQVLYSDKLCLKAIKEEDVLKELEAIRQSGELRVTYSKIMPQPESVLLGKEPWYQWRVKHWGVKWDIGELTVGEIQGSIEEPYADSTDDNFRTSFWYETPWGPATEFFCYATTKYDVVITLSAEESGVGLYAQYEIENGERREVFATDYELIWKHYNGDSVRECVTMFLECEVNELADEEECDYLIESFKAFAEYVVGLNEVTNQSLSVIVEYELNEFDLTDDERNLALSRLLSVL